MIIAKTSGFSIDRFRDSAKENMSYYLHYYNRSN